MHHTIARTHPRTQVTQSALAQPFRQWQPNVSRDQNWICSTNKMSTAMQVIAENHFEAIKVLCAALSLARSPPDTHIIIEVTMTHPLMICYLHKTHCTPFISSDSGHLAIVCTDLIISDKTNKRASTHTHTASLMSKRKMPNAAAAATMVEWWYFVLHKGQQRHPLSYYSLVGCWCLMFICYLFFFLCVSQMQKRSDNLSDLRWWTTRNEYANDFLVSVQWRRLNMFNLINLKTSHDVPMFMAVVNFKIGDFNMTF